MFSLSFSHNSSERMRYRNAYGSRQFNDGFAKALYYLKTPTEKDRLPPLAKQIRSYSPVCEYPSSSSRIFSLKCSSFFDIQRRRTERSFIHCVQTNKNSLFLRLWRTLSKYRPFLCLRVHKTRTESFAFRANLELSSFYKSFRL